MTSINDIKSGNFLELWSKGRDTEFVNGNNEIKAAMDMLGVRISRGTSEVNSIEEGKINGIDMANYEPLALDNEWLTKLDAISHGQHNIQIGKLRFKRAQLDLLYCNEKFEPLSGEKPIQYVHQLQNLYKEKTGEELSLVS